MIKFLASCFIISGVTIIGVKKSDELKNRVVWLEGFVSSLMYIKQEILFSALPVKRLLDKLIHIRQFKKLNVFGLCLNNLESEKSFERAWSISVNEIKKENSLTNDDITVILSFGEIFGENDVEAASNLCSRTIELLKINIEAARRKHMTHSKLYKMLSIFAGIVIVILII